MTWWLLMAWWLKEPNNNSQHMLYTWFFRNIWVSVSKELMLLSTVQIRVCQQYFRFVMTFICQRIMEIIHNYTQFCNTSIMYLKEKLTNRVAWYIPDSNVGWPNVGPTSSRRWANVSPTCIAVLVSDHRPDLCREILGAVDSRIGQHQ